MRLSDVRLAGTLKFIEPWAVRFYGTWRIMVSYVCFLVGYYRMVPGISHGMAHRGGAYYRTKRFFRKKLVLGLDNP